MLYLDGIGISFLIKDIKEKILLIGLLL